MGRFLLTIQYRGTRYAGWQTQKNGLAVQQVIEEAASVICGGTVQIHGAGRTDAGVHARAQRAHLDVGVDITGEGLVLGINTRLPEDVRVVAAEPVDDEFHARYSAKGKTYTYRIHNSRVADVFLSPTHALVEGELDVTRMDRAARDLVGTHDYRAYTVTRPTVRSTTRTVRSIEIRRDGDRVEITVSGDGFLRYQIRRIVGLLIEIGQGRLEHGYVRRTLAPEHATVRWSAPASGLTLEAVHYDESPEPAAIP